MNSNCFFGLNDKPRFLRCVLVAQAVLSLFAANGSNAETSDLTNRSSTSDYAPKAEPAQAAKSPEAFVPKGWTEDSSADGDLNKDKRSDFALVVSSDDPNNVQRKLLILLRGADGLLHKSAESDNTIVSACGPGGSPGQVSIKNGVLDVHQFCGSRAHYESDMKYQFRDGQWFLIGFTNKYDDLGGAMGQNVDVNFLTGNVIASGHDSKFHGKQSFLEVRSPLIETEDPSVTDWAAPAAWLNAKSPDCPIVSVQSVHNKRQLFVRVQLQGSNEILPQEVRLLTAKRQPISPASIRKTPYGYILAAYDLNSPALNEAVKAAKTIDESAGEDADQLLRLTVEVTPKECGCDKIFATSRTAPGAIFLTKTEGSPKLQDVSSADGAYPHPFLWKLTEPSGTD